MLARFGFCWVLPRVPQAPEVGVDSMLTAG
jgi:hypothetical protein